MLIMRKKLYFGKIDLKKTGKKVNDCYVRIELHEKGGGHTAERVEKPRYLELQICGEVWNARNTDVIMGGQCLDNMLPYLRKDGRFIKVYNVWKNWHLNGMHSGTPEQEAKIREWEEAGNSWDYDKVCEMLEACGLYEVEYTGKASSHYYDHEMYAYGHDWIVNELPDDVLKYVREVV